MHSELSKLRREMDALRAQLQAATDQPCMAVRIRRVAESGEIVTTVSGNTAGPGHTCSDNCKALIIGLAEDPEAADFRERLAQRVAREVKAHSGSGAEAQASLERTRRTCAFYGVPFPEVAERPCADASGGSATSTEGAGARSDRGRGDAQPSPERASAESTPEPADEPARSPEPAYGPEEGPLDVALGGRARDTVLEARRVSVPLGAPPPQLGPEDVVGGPDPHGPCAIPWCLHPLQSHRSFTERLPCRHCGWPVGFHDGVAVALDPLPYAARRLWPCAVYLSIAFEGGEHDGCSEAGCTCPGWRRVAPYVSPRQEVARARLAEEARVIAGEAARQARLRDEREEAERAILRAQGPNPLGPSPHSVPVFEGESR